MPSWPRHPLLYQVDTRVWLRELAARSGSELTLGEVPDAELDAWQARGFDAVWLMGVWTPSAAALAIARSEKGPRHAYDATLPDWTDEDVIGSPYAIGAYRVSPLLGGPKALRRLRERMAARGLRLILDFVPNHTAMDHPLTVEHPEAYIAGSEKDLRADPPTCFRTPRGRILAHGKDPNFPGWIDTAQVDVTSRAGRRFFVQTLVELAGLCDGVRCDMAMLLLPDVFERTWGSRAAGEVASSPWRQAIGAARAEHPDFLFVAEAYWDLEPRLHEEGFDFTYDKALYDGLLHGDAAGVRRRLRAEPAFLARCCHFVENHDEERSAKAFGAGARAAAAVALCAPGLRLIQEGQLEGRRTRIPVQLGRRPAEPTDPELSAFYDRLLSVLGSDALREGAAVPLEPAPAWEGNPSHAALVPLAWRDPEGRLRFVLVANLAGHPAQGRIRLDVAGDGAFSLLDHFDEERYERDGAELRDPGLYVALDAHALHLFEVFMT